jgi:hypothetical protein
MRRFSGIAAGLFFCVGAGACGKTIAYTDASNGDDDAVDAMTTPPGQVTVTTKSRCCSEPMGTLKSGIQVLAIQPHGEAGDSGATDASGVVTLEDVQAGATITAIYPTDDGYDLVTVVGVQPGDDLVFGERYQPVVAGTDGLMNVSWPQVVGSPRYDISHPCTTNYFYGETTTSGQLNQYAYCQTPTGNIRFIAYDPSYYIAQTGSLRGVAYTNGASVSLPSWSPPFNFSASISGVPTAVDQVQLNAYSYLPGTQSLGGNTYLAPDAGNASGSFLMYAGGDSILASARMTRPGDLGPQDSYQTLPATATSATFTAPQMPWVGGTLISASGASGTWVQVGDEPYDGAVAYASWSRFVPDGAEGGTYTYYSWQVTLPPGVTGWSWTDAPAALADYLPTIGDSLNSDIELVDLSTTDGFDTLRATPEWIYACPQCSIQEGDLDGTANVAYAGNDGGEGLALTSPKLRAPWRVAAPTATTPAQR